MRKLIVLAGMITISSITGYSSTLQDNINGSAVPPFVRYAGPTNIGWYYTANSTYNLDGISTNFEPVSNGTGSRTITVQIWTDRPAVGGSLLGQNTFTGNSASGGVLGASFTPTMVTSGQSYFVDFLNTVGMGVNLGQWANDGNGVPHPSAGATTNLGGWYADSNGTFPTSGLTSGPAYYTTSTGNVSFSEPILLFNGNPISTNSAPEPSTFLLIGTGVILTAAIRRRRSI